MFKRQNKRIKRIIILGALLGLIRSIFFLKKEVFGGVNDLLQGLINTIEENNPTEDIFQGDAMTENIYKKALKGQKRKESTITNTALDNVQFMTSGMSIEKEDLLKILYNSNPKVYLGLTLGCETCKVTTKDINNSYKNTLTEFYKIGVIPNDDNSVLNRNKIDNRVNSQFIVASSNTSSLKDFNKETLGEDIFVNGVADDSDYDLQVDIKNIGDLLFESFIAPIETVFYKLPKDYGGASANNKDRGNSNSPEKEELLALLQNTITGSGSINTDTITNGGAQGQIEKNPGQTAAKPTQQQTNDTKIGDTVLQNFVNKNTLAQKTTTQGAGIQGDVCRDGVSAGPNSIEDQEKPVDPEKMEEYLSAVENQIASYDTLYPEDKDIPNITSNDTLSGMSQNEANQFIEDYTDSIFNVTGTEACLKSCSSLPVSERVICQIQCLCFTMTRPNDPDIRTKSMNEMLKLRFCMVPAKSMAIPKGKNIYSLDDILTRIQANMDNVVNGGDMVKFQKNKEFLDNPIAEFSFSKLISFQINLNMKPIFNNKSEIAKKDQRKNDIKKLAEASGKEQTPGIDANKYVVAQDTIKNKVYKEVAISAESYLKKYNAKLLAEEKAKRQSTQKKDVPVIAEKKSEVLTKISDFLKDSNKFREQVEKELQNINRVSYSLQNKL